jgi:phosphoserine phosphatase RsbU/P
VRAPPSRLAIIVVTQVNEANRASHYQSATAAALVGGDLYDLTMTQFGPRFIIGDVKGKGLDAVARCATS